MALFVEFGIILLGYQRGRWLSISGFLREGQCSSNSKSRKRNKCCQRGCPGMITYGELMQFVVMLCTFGTFVILLNNTKK